MEISEFHQVADDTLEQLAEELEVWDEGGNIEVDLLGEVLTINLEDGREYVINKHEASQQIWVSSPVSGAAYYSYHGHVDLWENDDGELKESILGEVGYLVNG